MQSVPFSTNGSAHLELRYPGEDLPQLPAVEKFSKRKQFVGIVHHLPVDGTGADHPFFTALFELVTVQTQHLADLAGREEHRAVALTQQMFEEQQRLCLHEIRFKKPLEKPGFDQAIGSFC